MKESLAKAAAWLSHHRWGVLWTVIAVVGLYVLAVQGFLEGGPQSVPVLLTLAGLAIALHFGHCFTRDLPATGERVSAELRCIFRYAYGFLVIAMLFFGVPVRRAEVLSHAERDLGGGGLRLSADRGRVWQRTDPLQRTTAAASNGCFRSAAC